MTARTLAGIVALCLATAGPTLGRSRAAQLPRVMTSADNRGFKDSTGHPFIPLGVTYYRPGTGWAPQVWKRFDPEGTQADFASLRALGGNCVRVFLTYGSFFPTPDRVNPEALAKLERFVDLAEENGLYVHPTGPDHWEGLPDYAKGDRLSDPRVLAALKVFWTTIATRFRDRPAVFAYDLLNEPEIPWDTPSQRAAWNRWLSAKYPSHAALTNAWKRADVPEPGAIPAPPREDAELDPRLLDYQHFRESLAVNWTRLQVEAIRAADPRALVTAGFIQWSLPIALAHIGHYSAFRPSQHAPFLDFLTFHFYPLANGAYHYDGPEAERRNLAYLDCLAREFAGHGKPVVIGEFGWYGGGRPKAFKEGPAASEEDQARWCSNAVKHTRDRVAGWLNWGLYDQPEATDVSQFTGLLTADGREKAWGRTFRELSADLRKNAVASWMPAAREDRGLPVLDWDRLITSRRAAEAFRARWLEDFRRRTPP